MKTAPINKYTGFDEKIKGNQNSPPISANKTNSLLVNIF